jgi:biotin transporter BioY/ABC-type ATPase involved in cell division
VDRAPREEIAVKTKDLAYVALFAAIVAVLGQIPAVPVPGIPVPITAQTLGVMLAGSVLGAKRGGLALLLFLAVVAMGVPLLASGAGGLGVFVGPTAGYLYSWPIAAFVIGWLTERFWRRYNLAWALVANLVGGIAVIYAIGIPFTSLYADIPLSARRSARWRSSQGTSSRPWRPRCGRGGASRLPGHRAADAARHRGLRRARAVGTTRRGRPGHGDPAPDRRRAARRHPCYGDRTVLADVSLTLTESRIGVIGANGSGKSTFARLLTGLVVPTAGTVLVDGLDTRRQVREVRRQVGFVFQDPDAQIVHPTVAETSPSGLTNQGRPADEIAHRVDEVLDRYGLDGHRDHPAHLLSGGQKQLLAIAGVLVMEPQRVVFDEPTTCWTW